MDETLTYGCAHASAKAQAQILYGEVASHVAGTNAAPHRNVDVQ